MILVYASLAALVIFLGYWIYPILFPTIISYPWEKSPKKENRTVIFAASYNPPHNGHLALLEYLTTRYTHVIAVIGFNPDKQYQVSPNARADLLRKMVQEALPVEAAAQIQVEVVEGYIWRYAKKIGATLFFRGIRSWEKDGSDERTLQILNTWGPMLLGPTTPIPTIYIEGNPKYNHVSSTLIRQICSSDDAAAEAQKASSKSAVATTALSELVPTSVSSTVADLYG
ncbi:MAG: hypothetical protein SGILL_007375 [Bacillariaceae sp.]